MLRIGTTVVGVDDLHRAYAFWRAALGYVPRRGEPAGDADWVILDPPEGETGASIALDLGDRGVQEWPRLHLDLYAGDSADQAAEVERLVGLGASRVDAGPDAAGDFVILTDTEGNRFCVIDTSWSG